MKLVNKWNMGLHRFAAKESSRYSIAVVYVTDKETAATDGKQLLVVTMPDDKPEDFPSVPEFEAKKNGAAILLPVGDAKAIEKRIPQSAKLARFKPILQNAAIVSDGKTAKVATTDLNSATVTHHQGIDGKFPDYKAVFPKGDVTLSMDFDGEMLGEMLKYMSKFNQADGSVKLEFYGPDKAVKLTTKNATTGQQATGLVMPLDPDKK